MNWIKNIIAFFKRKKVKKIDSPEIQKSSEKSEVTRSFTVNTLHNQQDVETPICEGKGLGIQKKIVFW